ncbi:MAG TPA: Asp-tRNA(Asn)/Glu-tRNA(Gln) amidotransferase subunit GatA [Candidatus Paceibacterota bacterium]|jgi:aspartyl-tRNA(Asn)/glutamyl-tRNA(Gln) amidotransferase subunit A|nr:Asp-tRNA(Asn)/Glu-tRNA(Gln) amidotransferase subunit GatA [Candidatus Paceibacterota bacterium]
MEYKGMEELHKKIVSGEILVRDVVKEYVARAKASDLNAFREIFSDEDIAAQVAVAEKMFADGTATMLTGMPIALKDNILFAGHVVSSSSKMLEHYVASYDATVIEKIKKVGGVIIGRTNMDEFAMGSSTENSAFGVTKNPHDTTKVPGGSSGGSAAAVAADLCVVAFGSDTGGSIRQPAAFCGIVGLLPTYGSVSRHGLSAMGSSLDVIGPMAHSVADAEIFYNTFKGRDQYDSTSREGNGNKPLKKKLAMPKFDRSGVDVELLKNFEAMIEKLKSEGFTIDEVDLPHFADALAVYYILMPAEVSSNLARLDGIRYGDRAESASIHDVYGDTRGALFGKETRRRILLGTYVLSHGYYDAYYNKAVALRGIIRKELEEVLQNYDAIITPTTPTPAFGIGEKVDDPVSMYLSDLFTVPANIAQHPALSIPSGKNSAGLPFGIQFIGPRFAEDTLFALGKIIENIR